MMPPGSCLIVEHKTSSSDVEEGSSYWKRLRLDAQVSTYMVGARALGFEPVGVLYDVIRKPRFKPMKATPVEARAYTKMKDKKCPECRPTKGNNGPHAFARGADGNLYPTGPMAPDAIFCAEGRLVTDPGGRLYANMRDTDETLDEYRARLHADIKATPDSYYKRGAVVRSESEERDAAHDAWDVADQIAQSQRTGRWSRNVDACERYGRFCDYFSVCTGEASIDDATRFRKTDKKHEELDGKHRLPLVTTSGMKAYRRCAREYSFSYERGIRSIEQADALAFGTLVHVGLEVWWKTVDFEQAVAAMRSATTNELHLVQAEELMRGYHARWCEESFDVLAVEREFAAPLVDPTTGKPSAVWELGGKIDAIARVAA